MHDASYFQYFELEGPINDLRAVLDAMCDPSAVSPASKRYVPSSLRSDPASTPANRADFAIAGSYSTGSREVTVDVYDPEATYPHGRLGPATFIWKPEEPLELDGPVASTSTSPTPVPRHTVLVRVHPAIARAAALAAEHVILSQRLGLSVALRRFDGEYLTFEVTGQRATEVIKAVLRPTNDTDGQTKEVRSSATPRNRCILILCAIASDSLGASLTAILALPACPPG